MRLGLAGSPLLWPGRFWGRRLRGEDLFCRIRSCSLLWKSDSSDWLASDASVALACSGSDSGSVSAASGCDAACGSVLAAVGSAGCVGSGPGLAEAEK